MKLFGRGNAFISPFEIIMPILILISLELKVTSILLLCQLKLKLALTVLYFQFHCIFCFELNCFRGNWL